MFASQPHTRRMQVTSDECCPAASAEETTAEGPPASASIKQAQTQNCRYHEQIACWNITHSAKITSITTAVNIPGTMIPFSPGECYINVMSHQLPLAHLLHMSKKLRKPSMPKQFDPFSCFDITPACNGHRKIYRHRPIANTMLA